MKFGILTPVLSLVPDGHAPWEVEGTIEDVRHIAHAADRLGFDYLTCSEHMAIPEDGIDLPGPRYWDPLSTFGYLAAHTSRIALTTSVLVLGYHHPLEIAKRFGTLDRICDGRLIMGVGAGYLQKEFELLGAPFDDRGPRADDAIRAIRASFGRRTPAYDGPFYRFAGIVVDPCAMQAPAPIWIGGRSVGLSAGRSSSPTAGVRSPRRPGGRRPGWRRRGRRTPGRPGIGPSRSCSPTATRWIRHNVRTRPPPP